MTEKRSEMRFESEDGRVGRWWDRQQRGGERESRGEEVREERERGEEKGEEI